MGTVDPTDTIRKGEGRIRDTDISMLDKLETVFCSNFAFVEERCHDNDGMEVSTHIYDSRPCLLVSGASFADLITH